MALPKVNPTISPNAMTRSPSYQEEMIEKSFQNFSQKMSKFMDQLSARLETVLTPGLAAKQAAYGAFGNNVVTRAGITAAEGIADLTEGMFGPAEDPVDDRDPISKALALQTAELKSAFLSLADKLENSNQSSDKETQATKEFKEKLDKIIDSLEEIKNKEARTPDEVERVRKRKDIVERTRQKAEEGETFNNRVREKLSYSPTSLKTQSAPKSPEEAILRRMLLIMNDQSKSLAKMSEGPLSTREKEAEDEALKRLPNHRDTIDVESKVVKDKKEDDNGGWFSKLIETFKTLGTVAAGLSSVFGSVGKMIMSAASGLVSFIAKLLGKGASGAIDAGKAIVKGGAKLLTAGVGAVAAAGTAIADVAGGLFDKTSKVPATKLPEIATSSPNTPVKIEDKSTQKVDSKGNKIEDAVIKREIPTVDPKKIDVPEKQSTLSKIGSKLGSVAKGAAKIGKFIPGVGLIASAADAAYSAGTGAMDANKIFGVDESSTSQKVASGLGGVAESLSFGLLDRDTAAKKMHDAYSSFRNSDDRPGELAEKTSAADSEKKKSVEAPTTIINNVTNNKSSNIHTPARPKPQYGDVSFSRYVDSTFRTV